MSDTIVSFVTHDSRQGRGGWHEVNTYVERNALPLTLLTHGTAVFVREDESVWTLKLAGWSRLVNINGTAPAYDDAALRTRIQLIEEKLTSVLTPTEIVQLILQYGGNGGGSTPSTGVLMVLQTEAGATWVTETGAAIELEASTYVPGSSGTSNINAILLED